MFKKEETGKSPVSSFLNIKLENFLKSRKWQSALMFPCVWLRHMDFLNIPPKQRVADATALYSPSGLISGFAGHPCPAIAALMTEYIRKSHVSTQDYSVNISAVCPS